MLVRGIQRQGEEVAGSKREKRSLKGLEEKRCGSEETLLGTAMPDVKYTGFRAFLSTLRLPPSTIIITSDHPPLLPHFSPPSPFLPLPTIFTASGGRCCFRQCRHASECQHTQSCQPCRAAPFGPSHRVCRPKQSRRPLWRGVQQHQQHHQRPGRSRAASLPSPRPPFLDCRHRKWHLG